MSFHSGIWGGIADIVGGFFDRSQERDLRLSDRAFIREREDSRFQRGVRDARAAGLHPLFAMGAAGAGSPQFIAGQHSSGSALGDAVRAGGRTIDRYASFKANKRLRELQELNAEVDYRKNLLDEQLLASDVRRTVQNAGSQGRDRSPVLPRATGTQEDVVESAGLLEVVPNPTRPPAKGDSSRVAGTQPLWQQWDAGKGIILDLPWTEEGAAEAVNAPLLWPAILIRNAVKLSYWLADAIQSGYKTEQQQWKKFKKDFMSRMKPLKLKRRPLSTGSW